MVVKLLLVETFICSGNVWEDMSLKHDASVKEYVTEIIKMHEIVLFYCTN